MRRKSYITGWLVPLLLMMAIAASAAGDIERETLEKKIVQGPTPADLSAFAYLSSPMIQAARSQWRATAEKYRIDTAWANPEVMVEGMYMTETFGQKSRPDGWTLRLTQDIPLPGKLGKAGDVVQADARIARFRLDAAVRDVVVAIRESYQELLYIRDARRTAAQNRELLDQLRKVGEGAYAANRTALIDVMKAQAQSGQLLYDALLLEELEKTEKTRLNGLLNRPADALIGPLANVPVRPLVYDLPEIQASTESNLEEIRIAQTNIEKAQSMLSLTRYETLPEFKLGASYGTDDGAKQMGFQVGIMLPIWYGKNAGRLGVARADIETMQSMKSAQVNETRTMVRETYFRLQNSDRLVRLYRDDLLPQASRAIESAETLYKQGQGAFSDYVETQSTFYGFQLSLSRAKADYGKFLARLEKLAGKSLTDREAAAGPRAGNAEKTAQPDDFDAQVQRLRALKESWEKTLTAPVVEESFLVPDATRLERLKGAVTDNAAAEKALSDGFPIEDLETLALLRNPGIASKERELRAALEGYSQVENLDTILRRYSAFTTSLMTGIGPMEGPDAMIRGKFPFPGVLALKGEIVTQETKAARENLEAARRKAVTSVRKSYRELLYVQDARKSTETTLDLLDNLKNAASARYSAGGTNFQDVLKIGIEREKMKEELRTLGEEQKNMESMIREALALPPSVRIGIPATDNIAVTVPAIEELQTMSLEKRQELRAMRAMVGKMERMLLMQETMIHPGFSLNLSQVDRDEVSRIGAGGMGGEKESFPSTTVASVGAGLPKTPIFGTQEAYLRELRQRIEGLKNDLRMEEASTLLGVRTAWFALDKAKREESLYGERVVTLSRNALETSSQGYSAGKVIFADVIESYRGWLEANLSLARSRADIGVAAAELENAVGGHHAGR